METLKKSDDCTCFLICIRDKYGTVNPVPMATGRLFHPFPSSANDRATLCLTMTCGSVWSSSSSSVALGSASEDSLKSLEMRSISLTPSPSRSLIIGGGRRSCFVGKAALAYACVSTRLRHTGFSTKESFARNRYPMMQHRITNIRLLEFKLLILFHKMSNIFEHNSSKMHKPETDLTARINQLICILNYLFSTCC